MNPADYLTRGVKLSELTKLKAWWEGPDYLCKDQKFWPKNELQNAPECVAKEVKKVLYTIKHLRRKLSRFSWFFANHECFTIESFPAL